MYTLEVNKLDYVMKPVKNPTSEFFGKDVPVIKGSFTIVDDEKYSGRKLWEDFYIVYPFAQKNLKRVMAATLVPQGEGETLPDWSAQFSTLNPAARFQVQVTLAPDRRDGPDGEPQNKIAFLTAKPV